MEALAQMTANGAHRFWPLEGGLADIRGEIRRSRRGTSPLTDALLARSGDPASGATGHV